jgi:hypothetical protein
MMSASLFKTFHEHMNNYWLAPREAANTWRFPTCTFGLRSLPPGGLSLEMDRNIILFDGWYPPVSLFLDLGTAYLLFIIW